jgi:perosamine synthetase
MSSYTTTTRISLSEPTLEPNAWVYVKDALDSGWVSSVGPYVNRFEQEFAAYFDVPRTVTTVNGTAALHIALILAGVEPGDEVIVPSLTFIASINAIRYVGAVPVFWDSAEDHWNADPALLESLLTPKTRAIMPVHLYGDAMNMGMVMDVAKRHGLFVIEDAAEALGATWQGQPCGVIGDIGCFSFNGNKTLTTGGGGLIVSRDPALMARAHYLINQAKDDSLTFTHNEVGYNYRLTNLQAALGVAQMESLPAFLEKRKRIWDRYDEAFADDARLMTFVPNPDTRRSCWLYGTALNAWMMPERTALELVQALDKLGIQSRPFFKPGHLQKPFLPFNRNKLPFASQWHRLGFNLPSSCTLSVSDQERVIAAVKQILDGWEVEH